MTTVLTTAALSSTTASSLSAIANMTTVASFGVLSSCTHLPLLSLSPDSKFTSANGSLFTALLDPSVVEAVTKCQIDGIAPSYTETLARVSTFLESLHSVVLNISSNAIATANANATASLGNTTSISSTMLSSNSSLDLDLGSTLFQVPAVKQVPMWITICFLVTLTISVVGFVTTLVGESKILLEGLLPNPPFVAASTSKSTEQEQTEQKGRLSRGAGSGSIDAGPLATKYGRKVGGRTTESPDAAVGRLFHPTWRCGRRVFFPTRPCFNFNLNLNFIISISVNIHISINVDVRAGGGIDSQVEQHDKAVDVGSAQPVQRRRIQTQVVMQTVRRQIYSQLSRAGYGLAPLCSFPLSSNSNQISQHQDQDKQQDKHDRGCSTNKPASDSAAKGLYGVQEEDKIPLPAPVYTPRQAHSTSTSTGPERKEDADSPDESLTWRLVGDSSGRLYN
ncbi:hypothetical protein BCV70DRAFT_223319 [Testicularia cyperi]|uniref:Uncharacterized protein n=1 Tax=Testicularia cyperi TaxID=1882483 RepID=A0A317XQ66_9BASI|nr:hypothetical protein BCV70DRAFT_223319 [Testicularia cyperi]